VIQDALSTYTVDQSLGADLHVFVTIKGFNQLAIVQKIIERKGQKSLGLTASDNASQRRYSTGKILLTDLARSCFDDAMLVAGAQGIDCLEPYHVAMKDARLAYTAGDQFKVMDLRLGQTQTFTNEWMAYLHTLDFSDDGQHMLTISTGFDTIQEVDLRSKQRCWEWNAWDHGFTYSPHTQAHFVRSHQQAAAIRKAAPKTHVTVIDDPTRFPREGLPTQETPLNLNGVFYGPHGQILATAYHRPELFVIERNGACRLINLKLDHPHSFLPCTIPGHTGYQVANTGAGQLLLLNEAFEVVCQIDVATLPADEAKKQSFGEWLQTVSLLDAQRGYFAAVDALRAGIHLIDVPNRRRRFIPNPPHWTIQTLTRIPSSMVTTVRRAISHEQIKLAPVHVSSANQQRANHGRIVKGFPYKATSREPVPAQSLPPVAVSVGATA
jgi:hypothetical protein